MKERNLFDPSVSSAKLIHRLIQVGLLGALLFVSFEVIKPFIISMIWAAILVYMTWPVYRFVDQRIPHRKNTSAFIVTLALILLIVTPLIITTFVIQKEALKFYVSMNELLATDRLISPTWLHRIPLIGEEITHFINTLNSDPQEVTAALRKWIQGHLYYGTHVFQVAATGLATIFISLLSAFFLYRDGHTIFREIRQSLYIAIGGRADHLVDAIASTTRAVVYGIGLTALVQALLAGVAYTVVSILVPDTMNPILLTFITFIIALIPFGTPLSWGSLAIWLLTQGETAIAVGLCIWCVLIVSSVDNIIRPIVISNQTKVPFLLILFGVLGGLTAFGFVGLFIGPVVLAVFLAVWREWIAQLHDKTTLQRNNEQ